ncbi:fimbria/pilus periplasmic chaperone [Escherichia albertii]|uniref:fimbria/pilus periplasmic chaperone n=1 Tax=Escherichia albertii TaxID=208962 RepID=UPI0032B78C00
MLSVKYFSVVIISILYLCPQTIYALNQYPFPERHQICLKYDGDSGEVKGYLRIDNPGENIWLIQSWVEDEKHNRYSIIYPPLTRIEKKSSVALKFYSEKYSGDLKWAIIKIIPSIKKKEGNKLTIPVIYRLRICNKNINH